MKNISYRVRGVDCVTKCPHTERMVGSYGCIGCEYHFAKLSGLHQVICRHE